MSNNWRTVNEVIQIKARKLNKLHKKIGGLEKELETTRTEYFQLGKELGFADKAEKQATE